MFTQNETKGVPGLEQELLPAQSEPPRPEPQPEAPPPKKGKKDFESALLEWVVALFIALVAALILTQVIFVNAQIPSESMEQTINVGDRVIGFRLSYLFGQPEREDIVIFHYPDDESQLYVKRVIGLPGDTVEVRDGYVYLNGAEDPLDDWYVNGERAGNFGPYEVPAGHYFMMGDNRVHSWDSRYWENTYVQESKIIGRVIFRIYPNPRTFS